MERYLLDKGGASGAAKVNPGPRMDSSQFVVASPVSEAVRNE